MEPVRVKPEPLDNPPTPPSPPPENFSNSHQRSHKHKHKSKDKDKDKEKSRKRKRDETGPVDEERPAVRIKEEKVSDNEEGQVTPSPPPPVENGATNGQPMDVEKTPIWVKKEGLFEDEEEGDRPGPSGGVGAGANTSKNADSGPLTSTSSNPTATASLTDFFGIGSSGGMSTEGLQRSVVEKKVSERQLGAPDPKMPKVAHYNAHDEVGEVKYVAENKDSSEKAISDHRRMAENGVGQSDGEDEAYDVPEESTLQDTGGRYFQKDKIFSKFNFETRRVDTTRLAVYPAKDKILKAIENHRVVIVDGFTGCGKTTQVPQFLLDYHHEKNKVCNIIVTQPRKIAAISVAKRVCFERDWKMGELVGFQVGMETKRDRDLTLVTYMTTGVLLQKLIATRSFGQITHILIDEVHERDLESDLLLLVIKKILQDDEEGKFKHVKLVLMSATMNAKKFSTYFPMRTGETEVEESPVIKIPHSFRHRVEEVFLDTIVRDKEMLELIESALTYEKATIPEEMYTVAVDCIVGLDDVDRKMCSDPRVRSSRHGSKIEKRGSVLCFLPGMEEINRLFRALNNKNQMDLDEAMEKDPSIRDNDFHGWDVVPLHSTITTDEQQRVFDDPKKYRRKIILSTNIAESSVTVPDVMFVIDFCLTKSLCIDPYTNFTTLRMIWASISQCIQRKGRTGRVGDGKVFRLVTKSFFTQLPQETKPEMIRSNLETVVLQLKKLNLGTPKELLAMALDPPVQSGIERAVANLKELGALTIFTTKDKRNYYDTCDGDLTFLGSIMTDLPIPQQCTRLIMLGHCFGVMKEAIVIAAALSVKNPFSTPFVRSLEAYLSRLNWSKKSCSDLFALYYVYKHWIKQFADTSNTEDDGVTRRSRTTYQERQWAKGSFVQLSVLREIKSTVDLIEERLARHGEHLGGLAPNPLATESSAPELTKEASLMLKLAIAGAFYPNYFHRRRPDVKTYERDKSREISGLDLLNTVYFKGFPSGHDGKLYATYVADYLSFGLNVPSIKFDGQKVLATFANRGGDKIGPISKGVFRAIKRRQIRDILEIPLASGEKEKSILKDWDEKLKNRKFITCPPQINLPGVDVSKIYVRVVWVENPGQFWINYSHCTKKLDEMVETINRELMHVPISSRKIVPNALCLAPYEKTYYRAKILLVIPRPVDESLVYFIDYGNTAYVKNSTIEDFTPSMIAKEYDQIPCLAVETRLSNIKPATIHGSGWHDQAKREFEMFSENAPFIYIDIYSVSKGIVAGRLVGHDDRRVEQNLNDRLVQLGFAEVTEEPTFSQFNHRARMRVDLQDQDERKAHNEEQLGDQLDFDFVQPNLDRHRSSKTTLKGPWSPLELDFQSLCHSSNTKQVKIDNNSVNSVVLDTEPTAPISRLLVAGHVGIQDRSGSVVARDTTIMPSVPGLLPLMAMLFSPKIELRVDLRQTKYTGVLCGLGVAPHEPDLPIYPDHDVEIVFDTDFDDQDVDSINMIRLFMNLILRREYGRRGQPNITITNLSHYQMSLKAELLKLLRKVRKPADEEVWPQEEYVWSRVEENCLVPPPPNIMRGFQSNDIFAPHYKVRLNDEGTGGWSWGFAV